MHNIFLNTCGLFSREMHRPESLRDFTVYGFVLETMVEFLVVLKRRAKRHTLRACDFTVEVLWFNCVLNSTFYRLP